MKNKVSLAKLREDFLKAFASFLGEKSGSVDSQMSAVATFLGLSQGFLYQVRRDERNLRSQHVRDIIEKLGGALEHFEIHPEVLLSLKNRTLVGKELSTDSEPRNPINSHRKRSLTQARRRRNRSGVESELETSAPGKPTKPNVGLEISGFNLGIGLSKIEIAGVVYTAVIFPQSLDGGLEVTICSGGVKITLP